jgi:PAS domain S-box-containing protein
MNQDNFGVTAMSEIPTYEDLKQKVKSLQNQDAELNRTIDLLRDSENKYRTFFENSLDALFIARPNGQVLEANAAACEMFGYTEEELIRGGRNAVVDPEDRRLLPALKERERKGRFTGELNFKRKDGGKIPAEITSVIFKTNDGDERASIIVRDISERKKSEEALRESEAFTKTVMDHLPIGLAVNSMDPAVDFLYMNDNFPGFYRTTRKALSDPDAFWDAVYEDPVFREEIRKRVLEDCAGNDPARMHWEDVPITRQGEETAFISARNIALPEKSLMISTVWDVTERKRAEDALRESERKSRRLTRQFNALLDTIPDNVTRQSADLRVIWANRGAAAGLKKEATDLVGNYCYSLWHNRTSPCESCPVLKTFRTGEPALEIITTPDGKTWELRSVPVKEAGSVVEVVEIGRDVTEHRKLEEQVRQSQKMESVGRLAGGVAHDFNNLLTVITGYSELLLRQVGRESPIHGQVEEIKRAGERAATLTQQLLAFSRKQLIEPKVVRLDLLVAEMHRMLGRLIGENIALQAITGKSLGSVKVDPGQFQQILMNLAVNARDAMPDGGKIVIETANVDLDEGYCALHPYMNPGRFVMLAVSDTGKGMSEEVKARIFEPFFTTKEKGVGTGLGLSTTYGAVHQAGGSIEVYSEVGIGTTFKIYLPRVVEEAVIPVIDDRPTELPGGSETVLIVEDEGNLRNLCVRILEQLGYRVLQARVGAEAIAEAQGYGDRIDLLLTDVVMPGMNGAELAAQLVLHHPGMKVLFTSGYTEDVISHHGVLAEGVSFLGKPYTPSALARKVREVIDEG